MPWAAVVPEEDVEPDEVETRGDDHWRRDATLKSAAADAGEEEAEAVVVVVVVGTCDDFVVVGISWQADVIVVAASFGIGIEMCDSSSESDSNRAHLTEGMAEEEALRMLLALLLVPRGLVVVSLALSFALDAIGLGRLRALPVVDAPGRLWISLLLFASIARVPVLFELLRMLNVRMRMRMRQKRNEEN
jgi:hypothetical protein